MSNAFDKGYNAGKDESQKNATSKVAWQTELHQAEKQYDLFSDRLEDATHRKNEKEIEELHKEVDYWQGKVAGMKATLHRFHR